VEVAVKPDEIAAAAISFGSPVTMNEPDCGDRARASAK
jgi:hypothetical protein